MRRIRGARSSRSTQSKTRSPTRRVRRASHVYMVGELQNSPQRNHAGCGPRRKTGFCGPRGLWGPDLGATLVAVLLTIWVSTMTPHPQAGWKNHIAARAKLRPDQSRRAVRLISPALRDRGPAIRPSVHLGHGRYHARRPAQEAERHISLGARVTSHENACLSRDP